MTFEQFVASEKHEPVDDLLKRMNLTREETNLEQSTGVRTYGPGNCYYIGEESDGRFSLILGNGDWLTDELPLLQRMLYDWAAGDQGWSKST